MSANSEHTAVNPLLLDIPGASSVLGITIWQLRGLIANGELPVVKVGRKLYLRRTALQRWAERAEGRHRT
jgi:excisionase family DNA binding protein